MQSILFDREKKTKLSVPIPILKKNNDIKQYLLTQNVFDPANGSPPNEFMIKLQMRMSSCQKINTERR